MTILKWKLTKYTAGFARSFSTYLANLSELQQLLQPNKIDSNILNEAVTVWIMLPSTVHG